MSLRLRHILTYVIKTQTYTYLYVIKTHTYTYLPLCSASLLCLLFGPSFSASNFANGQTCLLHFTTSV